jgi:hypothetical protein
MWMDDYHDNYVRPETMEEFEELVGPLFLYNKHDKRWLKMYENILKCIEIFGLMNVSIYHNDYMKYGDHLEPFLHGFWVNLQEGEYNEGYIDLEGHSITIEDGFMFIKH